MRSLTSSLVWLSLWGQQKHYPQAFQQTGGIAVVHRLSMKRLRPLCQKQQQDDVEPPMVVGEEVVQVFADASSLNDFISQRDAKRRRHVDMENQAFRQAQAATAAAAVNAEEEVPPSYNTEVVAEEPYYRNQWGVDEEYVRKHDYGINDKIKDLGDGHQFDKTKWGMNVDYIRSRVSSKKTWKEPRSQDKWQHTMERPPHRMEAERRQMREQDENRRLSQQQARGREQQYDQQRQEQMDYNEQRQEQLRFNQELNRQRLNRRHNPQPLNEQLFRRRQQNRFNSQENFYGDRNNEPPPLFQDQRQQHFRRQPSPQPQNRPPMPPPSSLKQENRSPTPGSARPTEAEMEETLLFRDSPFPFDEESSSYLSSLGAGVPLKKKEQESSKTKKESLVGPPTETVVDNIESFRDFRFPGMDMQYQRKYNFYRDTPSGLEKMGIENVQSEPPIAQAPAKKTDSKRRGMSPPPSSSSSPSIGDSYTAFGEFLNGKSGKKQNAGTSKAPPPKGSQTGNDDEMSGSMSDANSKKKFPVSSVAEVVDTTGGAKKNPSSGRMPSNGNRSKVIDVESSVDENKVDEESAPDVALLDDEHEPSDDTDDDDSAPDVAVLKDEDEPSDDADDDKSASAASFLVDQDESSDDNVVEEKSPDVTILKDERESSDDNADEDSVSDVAVLKDEHEPNDATGPLLLTEEIEARGDSRVHEAESKNDSTNAASAQGRLGNNTKVTSENDGDVSAKKKAQEGNRVFLEEIEQRKLMLERVKKDLGHTKLARYCCLNFEKNCNGREKVTIKVVGGTANAFGIEETDEAMLNAYLKKQGLRCMNVTTSQESCSLEVKRVMWDA